MSSFERREKAFETKFAHDLEMAFKINARRNKIFGLWAAERLGLDSLFAQEYAQATVLADFEGNGTHEAVLAKVGQDLKDASVSVSKTDLEEIYDQMMDEAISQLQKVA